MRDQGARPTCLAFATSDLHAAVRPGWEPLSCEAIFHHAQRRAGLPTTSGAVLRSMLDALSLDGQPLETQWPYRDAAWGPPDHPVHPYHREGGKASAAWTAVIETLENDRPALALMTLSASFFRPDADGVVRPATGEGLNDAIRHALACVGHGHVDGQPAILVRNSWGEAWGDVGHAWLTADYVTPRLFAVAALQEDPDVSANSAAT